MAEIFETAVTNEQNEMLENLFQAARKARKASDYATALKYYEEINAINPNSFEAKFYLAILKANKKQQNKHSSDKGEKIFTKDA